MSGDLTAHAHDGGVAVGYVADGGHVSYHAAPRPEVSWPHQVGVLPVRADRFQDRAAAQRLEQVVAAGGSTVLTGMGGVGKTQLAAHHARAWFQAGRLDLLVWVTAATPAAVVSGYAQAAVEVLGADPGDPEHAARQFLAWLEPAPDREPCRWLVVLDDLADPADLRGQWPPASPHGRTLITTRRRDAVLTGAERRLVPVGLFTTAESVAYLTTALAAHDRREPAERLTDLAGDLGDLPLALSQAVAYMVDADLDCTAYRTLLADRAHALTDVLPDPAGLPDDQAANAAAAWSLSIDRADRLPPAGLARPMLRLAAMLDPNGIPAAVLTSPPALAHLAEHRTASVTADDAVGALRALHRLSLIDHTPHTAHLAVRLHQLVQRAARDALPARERDRIARTAADALVAVWPGIERDADLTQALRANVAALTGRSDAVYGDDGIHMVLFRAGRSLGDAGQPTAAIEHFQRVAEIAHRRLGPDHLDTLTVRNNLAYSRGEAGDLAGAVLAFEELLADQERTMGRDDRLTLITRDNLARWRGAAGDAAGAVSALEELLPDRQRILGHDHPDTLTTRGNLAHCRGEAGDAAGAVAAFEELLPDQERVVGPDAPATLTVRGNLAYYRGAAGDEAGAVAAFTELLADVERLLGHDHPQTLLTRDNLARWRGDAGDEAGAVTALEELLPDRQRILGHDHPDTLLTRHNLANFRGYAGDTAGCVAALAELLLDIERALGADHPQALTTRNSLAYWREEAEG